MQARDVTANPLVDASAHRATLSDAGELARLRWTWRAVERNEQGDPDRFLEDLRVWMAEHSGTHLPFLVELGGSAVGMAWLGLPSVSLVLRSG